MIVTTMVILRILILHSGTLNHHHFTHQQKDPLGNLPLSTESDLQLLSEGLPQDKQLEAGVLAQQVSSPCLDKGETPAPQLQPHAEQH